VTLKRRSCIVATLLVLATWLAQAAQSADAADEGDWQQLRDGAVVLFRHTNAPGVGDPPGMRLGDCTTQRNLDDAGRAQARRLGAAFRARGIKVGTVFSSQWCRARDTAKETFPDRPIREDSAFNSFFADRGEEPRHTAAARDLIHRWRGPGVMVVVTHQVNITALTQRAARPGEGIVLHPKAEGMRVVGTVRMRLDDHKEK
jgi:phosphohistidine phosphatase SixA